MPLVQTRGAASAQGFGEFAQASAIPNYIEDMFSCFLYTGNTPTGQSINNGIDLSTKGGLVWCKERNAGNHSMWDTARGVKNLLIPNSTDANLNIPVTYPAYPDYGLQSFNTTGFTLGKNWEGENAGSSNIVSWTFRKQPKFFDVVTYTGTGANRTIAHSLGSVPGSIIIKRTDTTANWAVYHRSLANTQYLVLNSTAAAATGATWWNSTTPTSAVFSLGTDASVNASGGTYVAYIYAHDAGGFGLTGTDNVISCGTYTGTSAVGNDQNLGFEPQWILIKRNTAGYDWELIDTMRGWATNNADAQLRPNTSDAEFFATNLIDVTATGFNFSANGATSLNTSGVNYYYIAIRRGPMKVPTLGTSVFAPVARTGTGAAATITGVGFPTDLVLSLTRNFGGTDHLMVDRLRGSSAQLFTNLTAAESTNATSVTSLASNDGISVGTDYPIQSINYASGYTYVTNFFRRAPSFFDEVCYTGNGSTQTITHNLTVVPELIIAKNRGQAGNLWPVLFNFTPTTLGYGFLNTTTAENNQTYAYVAALASAPTATTFSLVNSSSMNASGFGIVAYLFATCAGVSKVFSYTGNGSSQTINCGFTAGSRFVMIKRIDSTGDWYVWDSARGIVAGNDPHLSLNTAAAEVTTDDSVDTDNTGFIVNQVSATNVNVTSATYIGIAIA